jgi:hypothetical protein
LVRGMGVEPTRFSAGDFKSPMSANSITRAAHLNLLLT